MAPMTATSSLTGSQSPARRPATPGKDSASPRDFEVLFLMDPCSEYVLRRDGTGVVTGSDCYPTSGTWKSPYDGGSWTAPSDVDIDHMVPLKNAWIVSFSSLPSVHLACSMRLADTRKTFSPAPSRGRRRSARPLPTTSRVPSCGRSPTTSTRARVTRARTRGSRL
jgi:hypothetical protein